MNESVLERFFYTRLLESSHEIIHGSFIGRWKIVNCSIIPERYIFHESNCLSLKNIIVFICM